MLIGIMSDSHDNLPSIDAAVTAFSKRKINLLLHCGDFIAPFAVKPLRNTGAGDIRAVFGNCDGEVNGLTNTFASINGTVQNKPYKFQINGTGIMMMHEPYFITDGMNDPEINLVAYGHTHKLSIEKKRGTLVINPGETCGYLTGKRTIVILDTSTMNTEILEI